MIEGPRVYQGKSAKVWTFRIILLVTLSLTFIIIAKVVNYSSIDPKKKGVRLTIKNSEDYKTSNWSGGKTNEIAIYPHDSNYVDTNFLWRVSSATVNVETSNFTKLPDYNRILMVLSGELDLTHGPKDHFHLNRFDQNFFEGNMDTVSVGKATDFNLMMRKNKCHGEVTHRIINGKYDLGLEEKYSAAVVFAVDGELTVNNDNEMVVKKSGSLIVEKEIPTWVHLETTQPTHVVIAKIQYLQAKNYYCKTCGGF